MTLDPSIEVHEDQSGSMPVLGGSASHRIDVFTTLSGGYFDRTVSLSYEKVPKNSGCPYQRLRAAIF